ncbi:MAG: T9SS type A sorting domain-containing protein [Bacteroidia bacterium]
MKKTTIKTGIISTFLKRFLGTAALAIGLNTGVNAQMLCHAAFTYTVGSNGHVDFTNTSTGTTPSTNYQWLFGDNTFSNAQSPSHNYTYNGMYRVYMQIDSSNGGCTSYAEDSIVISNGITCTLNPAFTYTAGSNGVYSFSDASTGVDAGMLYSWEWIGANGYGNGSGSSTTQTFPYNGTYTVTMTVGDSTQTCYKHDTQVITVTNSQACVVDFTYTLSANGQVDFTNISIGNSSYNWSFGDGNNSSVASPSHVYYNGTYHVNMWADTSNGACGGSKDTTITVTNGQNPPTCNASFTYTLLAGGVVDFTNTSSTSVPNAVYAWNFGDGQYSNLNNPSNTYVYNGTYGVTLTIQDTLGNNVCSSYQVVAINSASGGGCHDSAYFYMVPDSNAVGVWYAYLSTSNGNYPNNAVWYWGDGTSSTGLYPTHSYSSAGWYTICVEAYFACGDSSYFCQSDSLYRSANSMIDVHVVNPSSVGIKNVSNKMAGVKLYPNPFNESLTLELNSTNSTSFTYTMSDVYGKQIMNEKVSTLVGENKVQINTGNISSGVYFVTVVDNTTKKAQTIKVVK